ncbi:hypothetical protein TA3x_000413 [Tundrisphaera sp. TA3]|uniref:hypothetical protein n=1 Tax=Tundrisphaera sp. TA3 TaxID=3435775 RepID=UPI003EBCB76E
MNTQPIGILQTSYTVSITFVDKPDDASRARLKSSGYQFDRGRWFKNQSDSKPVTQEDIIAITAAN